MSGQGRQAPSSRTVRRWLDRWVTSGVLVEGRKVILPGSDKPVLSYTLPTTSSRALPSLTCPLATAPRKPLQELEKAMDKDDSLEDDVHCSGDRQPAQEMNGHQPNPEQDVRSRIPVPEGELGDERTKDIHTRGKKGSDELLTPTLAPELGKGAQTAGDVGAEVPGSEDSGRSPLGDDADLEVDDGRPSDHPDVAEQGSPVQRHDVGTPGLREWQGDEADLDSF